MSRIALVVAYLASAAATVVVLNAYNGDAEFSSVVDAALVVWAIFSVLLGWRTGQPGFALLALLAVPFGIPFGYPDHLYSEAHQVWFSAAFYAAISAALIFLTAFIKRFGDVHGRQRASSSS
jgi:hypothetical protein